MSAELVEKLREYAEREADKADQSAQSRHHYESKGAAGAYLHAARLVEAAEAKS